VLARERRRRLLILEYKHARSAPVKVRFEGLAVFTDSGMMLEAGVHVAITDHKAGLRLQWGAAEIVRQLDHLHWLSRLLMLRQRARRAAVNRALAVHNGHRLHVGVDGPRACFARLCTPLLDEMPGGVSNGSKDQNGNDARENAVSLHRSPSSHLSYQGEDWVKADAGRE